MTTAWRPPSDIHLFQCMAGSEGTQSDVKAQRLQKQCMNKLTKIKNKRVNWQQCSEMHICSFRYLNFTSWQLVSFVCTSRLDPLTKQTCSSSPAISQLSGFHSSNTPSRQLLCRGQEQEMVPILII